MPNIISYNQLMTLFNSFADAHPQINDYGSGPTSEIGTSRQMKFPYMWTTHRGPSAIDISSSKTQIPSMSLTFLFVDQINNQENISAVNGQSTTNEQEVLSDQLQIVQDFLNFMLTSLSQFGVVIREQGATIEPVYDETTDIVSGWVLDLVLTLKHSNCITPLGQVDINVPIVMPSPTGRYLTCDTLTGCTEFTDVINNLQQQIDEIVVGDICSQLPNCQTIQDIQQDITDIQSDILAISGSSITCGDLVDCELIQDIQQDITNIQNDVLTIFGDVQTIEQEITNIENNIITLSGSSLTCDDLLNCEVIQDIQQDVLTISGDVQSVLTDFYIAVNYEDVETFTYVAPEDFKINTITNPSALTLTIQVNGSPYTLGNTINFLDVLTIVPNTTGFIKLNCEKV